MSAKSLQDKMGPHGILLKRKASGETALSGVFEKYCTFLRAIKATKCLDKTSVFALVDHFNSYRSDVVYDIEERENSGQETLRSTMLEEFFCHLLFDLAYERSAPGVRNLVIGRSEGYVDLTFAPRDFKSAFSNPNPYLHVKAQDFVIGIGADLNVRARGAEYKKDADQAIVVPVIAIECKTYIEKNMLDSCAGTSSRLKKAMPYCCYIVAAEYMKMDESHPELTEINEVYVLCKASNAERLSRSKERKPPHLIDRELVFDLFTLVDAHIQRLWWDPSTALARGKVINRY